LLLFALIFIMNLSFLDICYTTTSIPSTLVSLLSERKTISFSGCAVQMFLGLATGTTECVLLGMMAFDRYVAICNPLRYPIIMSKDAYVSTVVGSWIIGAVNSAVQTVFVVQYSSEGAIKAFSTCSAHLTVVIIFYGTILFMYLKPESKKTLNSDDLEATDKIVSMFCGVMTPMLNPLIYSLRNKDVKEAVKHLLNRRFFSK
uniref:G-protein coupled receptors family 1 profile domain-containing protein n=1 Tax=Rhinopithecus bieti TaxID=61621 RepID=A0A2K6N243_RHIBE